MKTRLILAICCIAMLFAAACSRTAESEDARYKRNRDDISVIGLRMPQVKNDLELKLTEFDAEYGNARRATGEEQINGLAALNLRMEGYKAQFGVAAPTAGVLPPGGTGKLNQQQPGVIGAGAMGGQGMGQPMAPGAMPPPVPGMGQGMNGQGMNGQGMGRPMGPGAMPPPAPGMNGQGMAPGGMGGRIGMQPGAAMPPPGSMGGRIGMQPGAAMPPPSGMGGQGMAPGAMPPPSGMAPGAMPPPSGAAPGAPPSSKLGQ